VNNENHPIHFVAEFVVPSTKRGRLLGVAGNTIKEIQLETGVQITSNKDGNFQIFAPNRPSLEEAMAKLTEILTQQVR